MKPVTTLLFAAILVLPPSVGAKEKPAPAKREPTAPKSKLIDMNVPENTTTGGIISTELSGREVEFFLKAFEIGSLETWLGEQAKSRGEADKVRAVGDALQSTQIEENEMLARLAKKKGITLVPPKGLDPSHKNLQAQLAKLSGAEFDKAVMDQIAAATQRAVDSYDTAVKSPDKDVKYFAEQILPMVREKLVLAKKVSGKALPPGSKPGFRENVPPPPPSAVASAPAPAVGTAKPPVATPAATPAVAKATPVATPASLVTTKATPPAAVATPKPAATPAATPVATPPAPLKVVPTPAKPTAPDFTPNKPPPPTPVTAAPLATPGVR